LNRGGDRQANHALYRIAIVRMRHDPRTQTYVQRRRDEGRTTGEIVRCLTRYIAREIFNVLPRSLLTS
jgi:transposase